MTKTKKTLLAFLACVILVSISLFDNWEYRQRRKTGEPTVGTITYGRFNVSWTYTVEGISYKRSLSRSHYYYMQSGEQYIVYYDKNNPKHSSLSATEPVYDTAVFKKTKSLPLPLSFEPGSHEVTFKFVVDLDTINRTHRVLFGEKLERGVNTYPVYYRAEAPEISYIQL